MTSNVANADSQWAVSPEAATVLRRLAALCDGRPEAQLWPERVEMLEQLLGPNLCRQLGVYRLPPGFRLSVVVPVFNEAKTLSQIVTRVQGCGLPTELILVDDGSSDGSRELLEGWRGREHVKIVLHPANRGKGAAVKSGFAHATGDVVVIQDADLEYDPAELPRLVQRIVAGEADVVFGTRLAGGNQRVLYFWHYVGNKLLTLLSNAFTNLNLTDMETCYKVFRREVVERIGPTLAEPRFGIEPELTAKVASLPGIRIYEQSITYSGRTYAQGKKIGWRDGISALRCIVKYRRGLR